MSFTESTSNYHSRITGYDYDVYSNSDLPENLNFSLDEIRKQLSLFGYTQVPDEKLLSIKRDLDEIIARDDTLKNSIVTPSSNRNAINDWFITGSNSDEDDSSFATVTSISPNSAKMKRKTSRKKNTSGTDDQTSELNTPRTYNSLYQNPNNDENYFRKVSFPQDPVDDVFNYTKMSIDPKDLQSSQFLNKKPTNKTSLIKTNYVKSSSGWQRHDPVSRYHSYKMAWNLNKAPGESPHKQLRWAIKSSMMVKEVPKPRVTKINSARSQNNYIPPGENKRRELRWQVRQELANPDVYFD